MRLLLFIFVATFAAALPLGAQMLPATRTAVPATAPATRPVDLAAPTLVSLDLRGASLADAARALSEQSGTPQLMAPIDEKAAFPPITLRIEREPYLVAMSKLCVAAGVEPAVIDPARFWLRKFEGESRMSGPACASGPFLVIAQSVTASRYAHAVNPAADEAPDLSLSFGLFAEPKVAVVALSTSVRLTEAADEHGSLLGAQPNPPPPSPPPGHGWQSSFRTLQVHDTFTASLAPGRAVGRRIVTLKGAIDLKVVTAMEVVPIDDVTAPWDGLRVRGRFAMTAGPLVPRGQMGSDITLIIERGTAGDDDAAWAALSELARLSRAVLYDAQGRAMPAYGYDRPRGEGARLIYTPRFRRIAQLADGTKLGPPKALEWHIPAEVKEIQVPFEFKDLPLP